MDTKANIQCNKPMKLENFMLMYAVYNAKTLQKLINTVHDIHNTTSSQERLFVVKHSPSILQTLYAHSAGLQHYTTNSLLDKNNSRQICHIIQGINHPIAHICISNYNFSQGIFTKHFVNTSKIARNFDGSQKNTMSY